MYFGWWIVATHFVAQLFMVGLYTYAWSLLAPVVAADLGADMQTMNYTMSIAGLLGLGLPLVAGPLVDRWTARGLMLIGASALLLSLIGMSLAGSVVAFVAAGVLGFGVGSVLLGPMTGSAVVVRWFTENRGRALGLSAIGTSAGGVILPAVMGWGFEAIGWRHTLQLIAAGVGVLVLPMLVFRFRDWPDADSTVTTPPATGHTAAVGSSGEILRRPEFWVLTISLAFFIMCYTSTLANLGAFFGDLGLEVGESAGIMMLLAFCGGIGKLVFGELIDRMPLKLGMGAAIGATILGVGIFSTEPGRGLLTVAAVSMGLATGGLLPVWNAMVGSVFGVANFGRVMGLMGPVIGLTVAPGFTIAGTMRESFGSYVPVFHLFAGILVCSAILLSFLRIPQAESGD